MVHSLYMEWDYKKIDIADFPPLLKEIPNPPQHLYLCGSLPPPDYKYLAVVGSRDFTSYGKEVVESFVRALSGYPICIVSGLALGIDGIAHRAALDAGLLTLAVPGSGLSPRIIYPRSHAKLAERIVQSSGALLSEFEPDFKATPWSFPKRNRIMAGLSHATILIEAAERSGTLITARLTVEYNRELLVVPGNIFRENSKGVHQFLKLGATPITEAADILDVFGLKRRETVTTDALSLNPLELKILHELREPQDLDYLIRVLSLPASEVAASLMTLELRSIIVENKGVYSRCL